MRDSGPEHRYSTEGETSRRSFHYHDDDDDEQDDKEGEDDDDEDDTPERSPYFKPPASLNPTLAHFATAVVAAATSIVSPLSGRKSIEVGNISTGARRGGVQSRKLLIGVAAVAGILLVVGSISLPPDRHPSLPSILFSPRPAALAPRAQFEPACSPQEWSNGTWLPLPEPFPADISVWDASPDYHGHGCAQNWFRGDWYLGVIPPGVEGPGPENQARPNGEWPMSGYRRRAAGYRYEAGSEMCMEQVDGPWTAMREYEGGREDEATIRFLQDLVDRGAWLIVGGELRDPFPSLERAVRT